jgi:hypothetical protein
MEFPHHTFSKELESFHLWPYVKLDAPWGFVVYRNMYSKDSNEAFKRLMGLLQDPVAEFLPPKDFTKPVKSDSHFELIVMEDREKFAGSDSHTILDAFREWVADDLPSRVR